MSDNIHDYITSGLPIREALEQYRKDRESRPTRRAGALAAIAAEFPRVVREVGSDGLFYSSSCGATGTVVLKGDGDAGQILVAGISTELIVEILRLLESEKTAP
jgi:hypothetical protein